MVLLVLVVNYKKNKGLVGERLKLAAWDGTLDVKDACNNQLGHWKRRRNSWDGVGRGGAEEEWKVNRQANQKIDRKLLFGAGAACAATAAVLVAGVLVLLGLPAGAGAGTGAVGCCWCWC